MPSNIRFAVVCSSNQNRSMETHLFLSKRGFKVRSFGTGDKVKLPGNAPDKPNVYDFGTPYETMYQDLMRKDKNLYTNNGILSMLDRNKRIKRAPEKFQQSGDIFDVIFTVEERVYDQVVEGGCSRWAKSYPEAGGSSPTSHEMTDANPSHTNNTRTHNNNDNKKLVHNQCFFVSDRHGIRGKLTVLAEGSSQGGVAEEFSRRVIEQNSPVHVINIDVLDNHEEATLGAFMFCDLAQQ
ncbi:RNA polymerase II subunit A C-terminal domain phosphatase SSU72-like, partial [Tropilaelaps mercedesae]